MKRKKKSLERNNLEVVIVFLFFVFGLLITSAVVKLLFLISESKFDGVHPVIVEIVSKKNKATILAFSPDRESISVLEISSDKAPNSLGKLLAIPIDGSIRFKNDQAEEAYFSSSSVRSSIKELFFHFRDLDTNITVIDVLRLFMYSQAVSLGNITTKNTSLPQDQTAIDKISSAFFVDSFITSEKLSIEVINGTDMPGLANRLGRLLGNIGGNVITVGSSQKAIKISQISCFDEKKYTCKRLSKVLGFPIARGEFGISDVIIRIGEDRAKILNQIL